MIQSNGVNNTPLLAHFESYAASHLRVIVGAGGATGSILVRVHTTGGGGASFDAYQRLYFDNTTSNFELDLGNFFPAGAYLQCDAYWDGSFSGDVYLSIADESL
jgi:hypothetical protein